MSPFTGCELSLGRDVKPGRWSFLVIAILKEAGQSIIIKHLPAGKQALQS
jgi:hypothetical protein